MDQRSPSSVVLGLSAVVVLVLANAFFVAAEFALVGARRTRIEELQRAGDGKARLAAKALQSVDRYISATQLGITLASLGLGWVGEPALASLIENWVTWLPANIRLIATHGVAAAIAFSFITVLHIILGELVPKSVAILHPEEVSRWVAGPLIAFGWLVAGPTRLLNGASRWLLRRVGIEASSDHDRLHSPEEIRMLVEQSNEGGEFTNEGAKLLEGVFEFSEKTAQDVMTPRTQMVALASHLTVIEAADVVAAAGRSRYPVYTGSLDEIVGVVHAKDILAALRSRPDAAVVTLMRAPLFVPGTRDVEDVLADMKRLKSHLALVLDEYGGTAGLVTMEDLLEEIVGPIFDEHDRPEPAPAPAGSALLDGAMPIAEFNSEFDAHLDDTDYTTIGGLLFGHLGRLPKPGDRVPIESRIFEIAEMDGRRVKSVRVVPADR